MLLSIWKAYERFLRVSGTDPSRSVVRARSVYSFGWAFILIQIGNLVGMTATYGVWTSDHTVSVATMAVIFLIIHGLRFFKAFAVYGLSFMVLAIAATLASALPDNTGINSALLPFLVMMPMLMAFTIGPRLTIVAGILVTITFLFLYSWSERFPVSENIFYENRNLQRALQAC